MRHTLTTPKVVRIWIDKHLRIVSFHAVTGFECIEFPEPELFFAYTQELVQSGFRFQ